MIDDRSPARIRWLTAGWIVGPFAVAFLGVVALAQFGWPSSALLLGVVSAILPASLGCICFIVATKPRRWDWVLIVPGYFGVYAIASAAASIVFAIVLGAPK